MHNRSLRDFAREPCQITGVIARVTEATTLVEALARKCDKDPREFSNNRISYSLTNMIGCNASL